MLNITMFTKNSGKGKFTVQKSSRKFSRMIFSRMINMTQKCEAGADQFLHHHENTEPFEKRFRKDVLSLTEIFKTEGNPFVEETNTLFTVVSKLVMRRTLQSRSTWLKVLVPSSTMHM